MKYQKLQKKFGAFLLSRVVLLLLYGKRCIVWICQMAFVALSADEIQLLSDLDFDQKSIKNLKPYFFSLHSPLLSPQ